MRRIACLLCLLGFHLTAQAYRLIDFESANGYAQGDLTGQPVGNPPTWSGPANACFVTNAFGLDGSWCAQEYATPTLYNSVAYAITPADMEVPAYTSNGLYRIAFWMNMAATAGSSGTAIQIPVGRASTIYVLRMSVLANGSISAQGVSGTLPNVLWKDGASTGWVHFEVQADYSRRTCCLYIDGVERWTDAPFLNGNLASTSYGTFGFNIQGASAVWSTTVLRFDNIEFGPWPVPPPVTVLTVR